MADNSNIAPARKWVAIIPGAGFLQIASLKALWVNQGCVLTMVDEAGTSLPFTVVAAGPVDLIPAKITAISAGTVYGLFD